MRSRDVGGAICACAVLVLVLGAPAHAAAQFRVPIPRVCQSEPLGEQEACAAKQTAYAAWLAQLGEGVVLHTLTDPLRVALQQFYPGLPLSSWRFGYGPRQDADNATTDCSVTYFNNPAFVAELSQGRLKGPPEWYIWLAHELRHYGQCIEVGGRDDYSKMWWDDLEVATLSTMLSGGQIRDIHDQMAMEGDAIDWGEEVSVALLDCCVHPESLDFFFPPIEIEPGFVPESASVGDTLSFSAELSGGAEPYRVVWRRMEPDDGTFQAFATSPEGRLIVREPGEWKIELEVKQAVLSCESGVPDKLPCWRREWTLDVVEPKVTQLRLDETRLDFGESTTAHFTVEHLRDGREVTVNFSASHSTVSVTVPADAVVPGTGALQETGSFQVDIGNMVLPLLQDARIPVRAWIGSDPSDGASASVTVPGIDIESVGVEVVGDPMRREVYRVAVKLSRAVRVPVTIQLTSSDPRALEVPSSITVEPGQTSATIDLLPSDGLRDARDVTVRAFHAQPDFTPREATFTVRGSRR